jgi:hypothetical protein
MISVASAFRFFGFGLSPLLILPLFEQSAGWAFHVAATVLGVIAVVLLLALRLSPGGSESQARAVRDLT